MLVAALPELAVELDDDAFIGGFSIDDFKPVVVVLVVAVEDALAVDTGGLTFFSYAAG